MGEVCSIKSIKMCHNYMVSSTVTSLSGRSKTKKKTKRGTGYGIWRSFLVI